MDSLVTIVGAGPAGLACALQLHHAGIDFQIVNDGVAGGQLNNAFLVENYPGIPALPGRDLVRRLLAPVADRASRIRQDRIDTIRFTRDKGQFELFSTSRFYRSPFVVVATGTEPKRLPELEVQDRTFYRVAELDFVTGLRVIVIGSGEAAYDGALTLSSHGNQVTILAREGNRALIAKRLVDRVAACHGISVRSGPPVSGAHWTGSDIEVQGRTEPFRCDYLLINVGSVPQSPSFEGFTPETNGQCHLCGAVRSGRLGQASISVGEGMAAAMDIMRQKGS